jgi:hypothetical protein
MRGVNATTRSLLQFNVKVRIHNPLHCKLEFTRWARLISDLDSFVEYLPVFPIIASVIDQRCGAILFASHGGIVGIAISTMIDSTAKHTISPVT